MTNSPAVYLLEGVSVGEVEHEEEAIGSSVVVHSDGLVALLACCVPHLHPHMTATPTECRGGGGEGILV